MIAAAAPRREADPAPDDVRSYLEGLLGNPAFAASPRRKKLLAYLVERTLAGQAGRLKAYDIAVAVFGRDERFDPQADPIVRLEAHRLRRDLEHYCLTAGAADAIRIDVPKGGYAPVFTAAADRVRAPSADTAPAAPAISPRWRRGRLVAASALLLLATAGLATLWLHPGFRGRPTIGEVAQERGPSLVVQPFRGLDGGEAAALLATGLTNQLVADLMRVESLRVYAGGGAPSSGVGVGSAAPPPVAFRVEGTVQRDAATIRVTARLVDAASDEVLWSEALDRPASMASVLAVQEELARSIAERLALPNGAIAVAAERPAGSRPAATMFAFDCVQRAWLYRRRSDGADRAAVLACLDDTVALEPGYANAWAMKSFLLMDGGRLGMVPPEAAATELAASRAAAERAFALAPRSIPSLQALANVRYNDGAFAEAERLQREAIALSPRNPEALAQLGWRLWARGRLDEGIELLREAVARSWRSPTWYHQSLALALHLRGESGPASAEAVLGQGFCCGMGQAALAITAARVGHADEARAALDRALGQSPLLAADPRGFWRVFHVEERLIDRLVAGLRQAGLIVTAAG